MTDLYNNPDMQAQEDNDNNEKGSGTLFILLSNENTRHYTVCHSDYFGSLLQRKEKNSVM
jgi:hypothetical protein